MLLIPLMVLTGLTMSPAMDCGLALAARPVRRPAVGALDPLHRRSLLVLFILVHLLMVLLAGPINEVRSMITGRFRLPKEKQ